MYLAGRTMLNMLPCSCASCVSRGGQAVAVLHNGVERHVLWGERKKGARGRDHPVIHDLRREGAALRKR